MKLGVLMDPIAGINIKKDTTFAMLLAAQRRGWAISYMELKDLFIEHERPMARMRSLAVQDDAAGWHQFGEERSAALADLDLILMRKDPPVDSEYLYATMMLEQATQAGVRVVNDPRALRDVNEKIVITRFPQCIPPTLVTREAWRLREFANRHRDIVLKPLHGMGGLLIFRINMDEPNVSVIIETLTAMETRYVMAQKFLPEIQQGDKRILVIDGEPVPYALARVPKAGDFRGNLAAGGTGVGVELTDRDRWICAQVAPFLVHKGLRFTGLDVIGDYLTEINVTSPTCVRELDRIYGLDIAGQFLDAVGRPIDSKGRRAPKG